MGHVDPVGGTNPQSPPRVIPFGKYLLLDRIAVGGMAEVYTAKSFGIEGFEKIIAIKRMLASLELPIPSDPADLAAVLSRAEGYEVKFDKWTKVTDSGKKYQNVAVTQVLSKGGARKADTTPVIDEDEVPF